MTTLSNPGLNAAWKSSWPILFALAAAYLPVFYHLAMTLWQTDDEAHGPIILIAALFIVWQKRDCLIIETQERARPIAGWSLFLFGVLMYVFARSQEVVTLAVVSQIPVLLGILLITRGFSTIRALWFPLFLLVFMIPLPDMVVDVVTGPLKEEISELTETILYWAGYPIARSGVELSIGQYSLLVADACSGLHSMFTLTAMGLLYLYVLHYRSWIRNGVLVASLLPVAFVANTVRVIILVLVTYYFGDKVGQGFLHKFAGLLLFFFSLVSIYALDSLLGWILPKFEKAASR